MTSRDVNYLKKSIRNKAAHFSRANIFVGLANNAEQNLSNTLFLVATIFLGISSPLVSDLDRLPNYAKIILFVSWIFTIASILVGLWQILINIKYFASSSKLFNRLEGLWSELPSDKIEYDKIYATSNEISKDHETQSPFYPLLLQAVFMVLAIVLAVGVGATSLSTDKPKREDVINFKQIDRPCWYNKR